MKYLLVITLALFTIASCNSFRPNGELLLNLEDHRPVDDLRYFFLTLYDQFNLTEPTEIYACLNDKNSRLFFNFLYEVHQLLNDTKERNNFMLHLDFVKILALHHGLKETHECISRTKDFDNLLNALEIEDKDPESLMIAKYIYYQARFSALLNDFVPLVKGLDEKNNRRAGIAMSRVISNMVETFKYRGVFWLMHQAMSNGFAIKLDMTLPNDILRCWDNDSLAPYLEFFLKWSEVVSSGTWQESPVNTRFFWRDFGKDIMERIPKETWECVKLSRDYHELVDTIGIDIHSQEFLDLALRYINDNRLKYWGMMKAMKKSFDQYNFNHVGSIHARLVRNIAKLYSQEKSQNIEK